MCSLSGGFEVRRDNLTRTGRRVTIRGMYCGRQDLGVVTPGSVLSCGDEAVAGDGGEMSAEARDWNRDSVFSETCLFVQREEILAVRRFRLVGGYVYAWRIWAVSGLTSR